MEKHEEVLTALANNSCKFIDDHSGLENTAKLVGLYERNGETHVILLMQKVGFSINPLVLKEDGKVHLARMSVGGVVRADLYQISQAAKLAGIFNVIRVADPEWQKQYAALSAALSN